MSISFLRLREYDPCVQFVNDREDLFCCLQDELLIDRKMCCFFSLLHQNRKIDQMKKNCVTT